MADWTQALVKFIRIGADAPRGIPVQVVSPPTLISQETEARLGRLHPNPICSVCKTPGVERPHFHTYLLCCPLLGVVSLISKTFCVSVHGSHSEDGLVAGRLTRELQVESALH